MRMPPPQLTLQLSQLAHTDSLQSFAMLFAATPQSPRLLVGTFASYAKPFWWLDHHAHAGLLEILADPQGIQSPNEQSGFPSTHDFFGHLLVSSMSPMHGSPHSLFVILTFLVSRFYLARRSDSNRRADSSASAMEPLVRATSLRCRLV